MTLDLQSKDFKERVDELDRARRQLTHSMDASGMKLRHALETSEDTPPARPLDTEEPEPAEQWPRAIPAPSRFYPRARAVFLVLTVVGLMGAVAALQQRRPSAVAASVSAPAPSRTMAPAPAAVPTSSLASTSEVVSIPQAPAGEPFVVYVKAIRPCQAHIVVDGNALDWRQLKEGDEFVSRPAHDILIETNDAGALAATVNRKSIRLGDDGATVAVRLNSQNFQKFLDR